MVRSCISLLERLLFPIHTTRAVVERLSPSDITSFLEPAMHNGVYTLASYRHTHTRALLWQAKYYEHPHALKLLGNMLGNVIARAYRGQQLLVPIPLSHARLRERGYNQVTRVLEAALPYCGEATLVTDLLIRTKHTPSQTTLSRNERLTNLTDAFRVRDCSVAKDTPILLIDDVMTTGATLKEAQKTLKTAGYTNVTCIALAH